MNAIYWSPVKASSPSEKYSQFDAMMRECDVVLVEGDSRATAPRIEMYREQTGQEPLACGDPSIRAVVSDDGPSVDVPLWPRSDLNTLIRNLEKLLDIKPAASKSKS
jgi:molybdopterin-guanine dinucleotide biosynthesis protein